MYVTDQEEIFTAATPATLRWSKPELVLKAVKNALNLGASAFAEQTLQDFIAEHPKNGTAHALLGTVYERAGDLATALPLLERAIELAPTSQELHSALIFALDQAPTTTLERAYRARRAYNELVKVASIAPHANDHDPDRKLRVGYVSGDFRNHSAAFGWAPILLCHDRTSYDVYAYSTIGGEDSTTAQIRPGIDHWREVAYASDDDLEKQIRADQIDILIDLSGHSTGNRLPVFARHPAPVQISMIGYITGTGLDAMDYLFVDADTVHPDEERWYAEEIVRIPRIMTFWATDPSECGPVAPLPSETNGHLTFGIWGRHGKIQPRAAQAYAEILGHLPSARLIVKSPGLGDPHAVATLNRLLLDAGVDLGRTEFRGPTTKNEHMRQYGLIDVALDTPPHGGGMSSLEACWMGVPVLTLPHQQIVSRIATTINRELGLDYMVAENWDDFTARAVALNGQRDELAKTRRMLRDMMRVSVFGDHGFYARSVELRYRELWQRWCYGDGPKQAGLRVVA